MQFGHLRPQLRLDVGRAQTQRGGDRCRAAAASMPIAMHRPLRMRRSRRECRGMLHVDEGEGHHYCRRCPRRDHVAFDDAFTERMIALGVGADMSAEQRVVVRLVIRWMGTLTSGLLVVPAAPDSRQPSQTPPLRWCRSGTRASFTVGDIYVCTSLNTSSLK